MAGRRKKGGFVTLARRCRNDAFSRRKLVGFGSLVQSGLKASEAERLEFRFGATLIRVNMRNATVLMREISARLDGREGFALATINLDHLVKLQSSEAFRRAYAAQDLVVADGNPIVWLSKLARQPVELVPGSDLVLPLVKLMAQKGLAIALLGSTPESLEAAGDHLKSLVPGLKISARIAPPMGFDPSSDAAAEILHEVELSGARLCLLALGAPKQELLAARGRELTPSIGFASIGAGLDFLSGTQNRAPAFVRAIAMEWAWRMLSSPRRLIPRYMACAAILPRQILAALALRRRG